jgi:hypothetical protein
MPKVDLLYIPIHCTVRYSIFKLKVFDYGYKIYVHTTGVRTRTVQYVVL